MSKEEVRENKDTTMIISMTSRIDELADEAADPFEAGKIMRQVYFTNCKLTNRQLTVDLLKKLYQRGVGTHDVESIALKVIKGEERRNPKIVKAVIKMKLEDAMKWQQRIRHQSLMENYTDSDYTERPVFPKAGC